MGSCRQPLPWHIPPTGSAAPCAPKYLPKVSLHKDPSIIFFFEAPRCSKNAMSPFSRAPLNLNIALFIAAFHVLEIRQELLPTVCVCLFVCLRIYETAHNRATRPCHSSNSVSLVMVHPRGINRYLFRQYLIKRDTGDFVYLYSFTTSPASLSLPSLLPSYSIDHPSWEILNHHFLVYFVSDSHLLLYSKPRAVCRGLCVTHENKLLSVL